MLSYLFPLLLWCRQLPAMDARAADDAAAVANILGTRMPPHTDLRVVRAFRLLAEQVSRGIDYRSLGLGWDHPTARTEYRNGHHSSIQHPSSRTRNAASKAFLAETLNTSKADMLEDALVECFLREISLDRRTKIGITANFPAVLAALEGELLLPLRALMEGQQSMETTFNGWPVPREKIEAICESIVLHVLQGDFSHWRYHNPVGARQLEGLSEEQIAIWSEASASQHQHGVMVHEDAPGELGLFWATKIGGPSHGFDIEGQCLLPLLANARHKVVLVSDPDWPHHPAGRAHFRLLWTDGRPQKPVLWLETVNRDFVADVESSSWRKMVLRHVVGKAEAMRVRLSVDTYLQGELESVVYERGRPSPVPAGSIEIRSDRLVLRPSNGVLEASDYLSDKHDWVQLEEEVTWGLRRCIYTPQGA